MRSFLIEKAHRRNGRRSIALLLLVIMVTTAWLVYPTAAPAQSSSGGGGGGGFRFGIGIQLFPRLPVQQEPTIQEPQIEVQEPEDDTEPSRESRAQRSQAPQQKQVMGKLAKPRVPFLNELAVEIERSLIDMVRQQPASAIELYKGILAASERTGDVPRQKEAWTHLGHVYYLMGLFPEAAQNYSKALSIAAKTGDKTGEAVALRNMAAALTAAGDFREAEEHNRKALKFFQVAGNQKDWQMALNNMGVLEKNRARYSEALTWYETALEIRQQADHITALIRRNLGNFFRLWGEYQKAVQNYEASAALSAQLGDAGATGDAMLEVGQVYGQAGDAVRAVASTQAALQIFTDNGLPTDWAKKLMGDLLLDAGRLGEAEQYLREADYGSSLGQLYLARSDPEAAKKHYQQLLQAAQKEGNLDEQFAAHTGMGRAFEAMNNLGSAEQHYTKGSEIAENIRSTLLVSERKNFYAVKISGFPRSEPAKNLVRICLKQKKPERSIYPSEVIRARDFADNLSHKADGRHFNVPADLMEQEAILTNRLASLKTVLPLVPKSLDEQRYATLSHRIKQAESERNAFIRKMCESHKEYCAVKYPSPVPLERADIRPDEHVVIFDLLRDGVAVRLLKGKKIVKASYVEWNSQELDAYIRRFREPFERVQLSKMPVGDAALLHQRLTAHILESVPAGASIIVIPDGVLALLPFETLVTGGVPTWKTGKYGDFPHGIHYLGDRNPIVYSQSLTAMTLVRRLAKVERAGNALLVMADPVYGMSDERVSSAGVSKPLAQSMGHGSRVMAGMQESPTGTFNLRRLKESGELGNSLNKMYGNLCEVHTDLGCTKHTFLDRVSKRPNPYGSIVFGTHGFAANDLPGLMEPVLALTMVPEGTDGFLTMTDIAGLRLNAEVAALTACKTGVGTRLEGEGVMSMGRSFQSAGARSVIMSLWAVAEKPSVLLIEEFFRGRRQGLSKLQAWTRSRAVLREQGFEHPFFWGSFILVGEQD
ncbi:MAG: CHAT domain-containing protein [Thermodesulfobacteriota bacterium]